MLLQLTPVTPTQHQIMEEIFSTLAVIGVNCIETSSTFGNFLNHLLPDRLEFLKHLFHSLAL